jgi:CheY-like chemotaxis protein
MNTSVLIVDDETVTRHMLKLLLELSGFVIDEASDGIEAMNANSLIEALRTMPST